MSWAVIEQPDAIHVVPVDDLIEHVTDYECPCGPRQECDRTLWMPLWVHNALDHREDTEVAKEMSK